MANITAIASSLLGAMTLFGVSAEPYAETGLASFYGGRGHRGEMTCAHRTKPFGSMLTVTHAGRSIQCRVNDRGPFVRGRIIDVSISAARALGMMDAGVVRVSVESAAPPTSPIQSAAVPVATSVAEQREPDPAHGE